MVVSGGKSVDSTRNPTRLKPAVRSEEVTIGAPDGLEAIDCGEGEDNVLLGRETVVNIDCNDSHCIGRSALCRVE